jgi:hypothetical protein
MSNYYKFNFVSAEPIFSIIKEELKSYMDTGAVDDLLFPTYLNKCLRKLGKATYPIEETSFLIEDFQASLPNNFHAVREAWFCTEVHGQQYQTANSFYSQSTGQTTVQISPVVLHGDNCNNENCSDPSCDGSCREVLEQAVYKTNNQLGISYIRQYLLKPGNISTKSNCTVSYTNSWDKHLALNQHGTPGSSSYDSFDIRNNKFNTNFRHGIVHLMYYAEDYSDDNSQLIPDNYRVSEYIEHFIKFKIFETLSNQVNDESYNQIQQKMMYYKREADEAFIMAEIELRKQDAWTKQRRIKEGLNRFSMYELPNRTYRLRRRNN